MQFNAIQIKKLYGQINIQDEIKLAPQIFN